MTRSFDDAAKADVQNAVSAFVSARETFTSGHCTIAVRNAGTFAGTFGHSPVARTLRDLWDGRNSLFDGYTRSSVYLGGREVFAYHPQGDDPSSVNLDTAGVWVPRVDLASLRSGDLPRPTNQASTLPTARELYNGGKAAEVGDSFRLPYNSEGYAQVPRSVTRFLGLNPGDAVVLTGVSMSGKCSLRKANPGEISQARLQPANGQLRLRDTELMSYGVGNGDDLEVTVTSTELNLG